MAKTNPPFPNFSELSYDVLHHDLRVFIQGVEVTQDLLGSVSVRYERDATPNFLNIKLDNALDKYYLTEHNLPDSSKPLEARFSDAVGKYSERAKRDLYKFKILNKTQPNNNATVRDVFNQILLDSPGVKESSPNQPQASSVEQNTADQNSILMLAQRTVQDLPDMFFQNPTSLDGKLATSAAQAATRANVNPNEVSANNTINILTEELQHVFPNAPSDMIYNLVQQAAKPRIDGTLAQSPNPKRPNNLNVNPQDQYTGAFRWDFHQGDCILTHLDPVVAFATNPLAAPDDDEWMPVFTGYLTDLSESKDHLTGASQLSIVCQDIRYLMSLMRVASNTITSIKEPEAVYSEGLGLFDDLIADTGGRTQQFTGKRFEDTIAYIMTGIETVQDALENKRTGKAVLRGVGSMFMRQVVQYPPENAALPKFEQVPTDKGRKFTVPVPVADPEGVCAKTLQDWHTFALLGGPVAGSKVSRPNSYTGKFLSYEECTAIGSTTYMGHDTNDPIVRGVNLLLPQAGSDLSNMVANGIVRAGQQVFNFRDRLDILKKVVDVLNYVFYVTPHGDMMVEFPFYDFLVEDFGVWGKVFSFQKHLISSSTVLEKPGIVTGVIASGGWSEGLPEQVSSTIPKPVKDNVSVVITSPKLASRYGLKTEPVSFPFSYNPQDVAAFGMVKLQEFIGNANNLNMQVIFRPFLLPNRPLLNDADSKMGLVHSLENTWNIFETCTTTFNLNYIRTRHPVIVDATIGSEAKTLDSWRFLTGGCIMGFSYRYAYGISGSASPNDPFPNLPGKNVSGFRISPSTGLLTPLDSVAQFDNTTVIPGIATDADLAKAIAEGRCDPSDHISGRADVGKLSEKAQADLVNIVRDACVKVYVTSTLRSQEENDRVKGDKNSYHLKGEAWDLKLRVNGETGAYLYTNEELNRLQKAAQKHGYTMLNETNHLHFEPHRDGTAWYKKMGTPAQRELEKKIAQAEKRTAARATQGG